MSASHKTEHRGLGGAIVAACGLALLLTPLSIRAVAAAAEAEAQGRDDDDSASSPKKLSIAEWGGGVRVAMDRARNWVLNLDLRRVGALPSPASPAYTELDSRIGWSVSPSVELALTGSNLLHPQHLEFGTAVSPIQLGPTGVETGRSFLVAAHWRF